MTLNQSIYISDSHKNSEKRNKQINVLQSDKQPIYKTLQIVFFSPQNSYRSGHKKMLSNVF